jgi:hypothetical protein
MQLSNLRFLLQNYPAGSWFYITDTFWSDKERPRPFILAAEWTGGPLVQLFPRSTQPQRPRSGMAHNAHPVGHEPGCEVNKPGWIVWRRLSCASDQIDNAYSCTEPDMAVISALATHP